MNEKMKMYILVKEEISIGKAVVGIAHASLACYLKFQDTDEVKNWLDGPFYKTVCKVNAKEFEKAKEETDYVIITESTLDNVETTIAFKPSSAYPKYFNFFRLYKD
jgi:peptidyl-tRNA hydrolase